MRKTIVILLLLALVGGGLYYYTAKKSNTLYTDLFLSEPFLQLPTQESVRVVWFTSAKGKRHQLKYGSQYEYVASVESKLLDGFYEDNGSNIENPPAGATPRKVWRHEAIVKGLKSGEKLPYKVRSQLDSGRWLELGPFDLSAAPQEGKGLKILLTSDHQQGNNVPANLQKVVETVGHLDAVFMAGNLVSAPYRASEWFDEKNGHGFFSTFQGRTRDYNSREPFKGGAILQNTPIFPCIGNNDVMARHLVRTGDRLFTDAYPLWAAKEWYEDHINEINPAKDPTIEAQWMQDHTFNVSNYESIFTLPEDGPLGKKCYAAQFGDVYLITLMISRPWRMFGIEQDVYNTKYMEAPVNLSQKRLWGFGDFIFNPFSKGTPQYQWLEEQLNSKAFKQSKYRIVMLQQPSRGFGANAVPAMVTPEQRIQRNDSGRLQGVRYEYILSRDVMKNDIEPLLKKHGVNLVLFGHSHIWQHFKDGPLHYLESSNVGYTHGAFLDGGERRLGLPDDSDYYNPDNYTVFGDPFGAQPIMPSLKAPQVYAEGQAKAGEPMPVVASNTLTVFAVLDTASGTIKSYYFDTEKPDSEVVLFDEFEL